MSSLDDAMNFDELVGSTIYIQHRIGTATMGPFILDCERNISEHLLTQ